MPQFVIGLSEVLGSEQAARRPRVSLRPNEARARPRAGISIRPKRGTARWWPPRQGYGRTGVLAGGGEVGSRAWLGILGIGKRKRLDGFESRPYSDRKC